MINPRDCVVCLAERARERGFINWGCFRKLRSRVMQLQLLS